jgi:NAD(P)-dependent dehydrogenase (short-subunit alcohol dehydrogenase family)
VYLDVIDPASIEAMTSRAVDETGCLDVMCNNAAASSVSDPLSCTVEDWDRTFAVNARGVFLGTKYALRGHRFHPSGRSPVRRDRGRANCVCPGTVDSPWVARLLAAADDDPFVARRAHRPAADGRPGTPAEVATAARDRAVISTPLPMSSTLSTCKPSGSPSP